MNILFVILSVFVVVLFILMAVVFCLMVKDTKYEAIFAIVLGMILAVLAMNHVNTKLVELTSTNATADGYVKGETQATEAIVNNLEVSGVAYDSIAITFPNGEEHVYSYDFTPIGESTDFGKVKTYEDYRLITSSTAPQTQLNNLPEVYTDNNGLRKINDYYLVAMGSFYGDIGDIFQIELSSGRFVFVIKGDTKADKDTDTNNQYQSTDGSVIEFIVDSDILKTKLGTYGDVSRLGFEGSIENIELIGHYNF